MTDINLEYTTVSDRAKVVSINRGDGVKVDVDISVRGLSDRTLSVSVHPIDKLSKLELRKIEFDAFGSMYMKFDLGDDKRNG